MTTREVNWFTIDEFDSLGFFPLVKDSEESYICPRCGKPATYWEGVFDQDRQGNDIRGWSFDCFPCGITTGAEGF
jgi:DNA-directed RNA polymerase subunit RPC12/RpoP